MKQALKTFDDPGIYISRNNEAEIDSDSISGKIYANLAKEKTLEELQAILTGLTYRQLMIALNGMLMREEIQYSDKAQQELAVSEKICKEIIEGINGKKPEEVASHPVSVSVFSATPQLAKRFIGTLCGMNIAGKALINTGTQQVIVSELNNLNGIDFFDITASILVFDKDDTESLPQALKFVQKAKNSNSNSFIVAELPGNADESSQASHLLRIQNNENITIEFEWNAESSLAVIEKVFTSIIKTTT